MLRLLFTTKDNTKQLTVITDGIDSQLNVFVTENVIGDFDHFSSMGIAIDAGMTYNIGKFKEWAYMNFLRLISYPEGLNDQAQVLVDVDEVYQYTFEAEKTEFEFLGSGEPRQTTKLTSTRQLFNNGYPVGEVEIVPVKTGKTVNVKGSVNSTLVSIQPETPNTTNADKTGSMEVIQDVSGKVLLFSFIQKPAVITYEYEIKLKNTQLNFPAAGGTQSFEVTSKKYRYLDGTQSGYPTDVPFTSVVEGEGFSKGSNDTEVVAAENTSTSLRRGTCVFTASEGGKTVTGHLAQSPATA